MLWRDNGGKNPAAEEKDNEIMNQNETVKKAFSDVQDLKAKIEELKARTEGIADSTPEDGEESVSAVREKAGESMPGASGIDSAEVRAAELAVLQQAKKDAEEQQAIHEDRLEKTARIKVAQIRREEAREKLAAKQQEAVEKRRALKEAEEREAEMKKQRQKAELRAELNRSERRRLHAEALERKNSSEQKLKDIQLQKEQMEQERLRREAVLREQQERKRQEELRRRAEEEKRRIQEEERRAAAARKAAEQARREAEKIKAAEEARLAKIQKKREAAEKRYEKQHRKAEREKFIEEQRAIQRKKRDAERAEANRIREENRARKVAEKKVRKEQLKEERARKNELRKKKKFAQKAADMGGGIVAVHGTTVQTEIQPVPAFSLFDLLGFSKRKEIKRTVLEDDREKLISESERIKSEARATAAKLAEARRERRKNTALYKRWKSFQEFCDRRSKEIIVVLSMLLMMVVGTAGVFNYMTAYSYAYNGIELGYVKNKDDVLQITGMVQTALSEERNMNVVIDPSDDISFTREFTFNKDIVIDSQEEILKRLTYMGDVNVKSYGIYINGKKAGAVSTKKTAAAVLEDMKNKYASGKEGAEIKKAEIVENIEIRSCKTPMKDVMSEAEMVEKLSTDSEKEVVYTIERGDTLESIAENHGVTPEDIEADNANVDVNTLPVGSTIILHEVAPIMTVRITEVRTYEEKTDYETIKKKDKDLYEGYTEVDQKGEKGVSEVVDKTLSINGEIVETENLKTDVKKEPVDKIVRVGTKERPPTVGSGTYIWPANPGTYVVTSEFKWRWGRQHQGIDMGCSTGTDVLASDGGTVTYAGWMGGYGNLVIIDHQNGIETYYGHNSSLCVSVGDKVFQGQHIAEAGNTGNSFGSHIHFGVKDHGTFKNPRNYLP
ncbi:MAG: peptidoglycan DD-metalloendopeptidase family protein [Lentihominibacter sp.]